MREKPVIYILNVIIKGDNVLDVEYLVRKSSNHDGAIKTVKLEIIGESFVIDNVVENDIFETIYMYEAQQR